MGPPQHSLRRVPLAGQAVSIKPSAKAQKYPDICFLLCAALVFMLSNASCERGFSLQNHIKGIRMPRMKTETFSCRMRIASDVPGLSAEGVDALVAGVTDTYWSMFPAAPARSAGAAASHVVRRR